MAVIDPQALAYVLFGIILIGIVICFGNYQ